MRTVIDLFTGIGSFSMELEATGMFQTILACDNNMDAKRTFLHNNPHFNADWFVDDIVSFAQSKTFDERLYDADVMYAGIPCQSFSSIGCKDGMTSNATVNLIEAWKTLVVKLRPKIILLENVRMFMNVAFKPNIQPFLQQQGYNTISYNILNCKDYGIPQNRPRFFAIASRQLDVSGFMTTFERVKTLPLNEYLGIKEKLQREYSICIRTNGYCYTRWNPRNYVLCKVKDEWYSSLPKMVKNNKIQNSKTAVVTFSYDDILKLQGFDPSKFKFPYKTRKLSKHKMIVNTIPRCLTKMISRRLCDRIIQEKKNIYFLKLKKYIYFFCVGFF